MGYTYRESYPFMALARSRGVDYGHVLIYADVVLASSEERLSGHNEWQAEAVRALDVETKLKVSALCAQPCHLRGGRTDTP